MRPTFSASIGPKKYDAVALETKGLIVEATCAEARGDAGAVADGIRRRGMGDKYRIVSENPASDDMVAALLERV